jgi:hypothetical protein
VTDPSTAASPFHERVSPSGRPSLPLDAGAGNEEPKLGQPDGQNIKELWADFLDAIKTGRKPVSDIEEVHLSTNAALLGMLSCKLGRSLQWDGVKEECVGDAEANKLLCREYRNGWEYPG